MWHAQHSRLPQLIAASDGAVEHGGEFTTGGYLAAAKGRRLSAGGIAALYSGAQRGRVFVMNRRGGGQYREEIECSGYNVTVAAGNQL